MCVYDFQALIPKILSVFFYHRSLQGYNDFRFYDFPLTVDFICSYACCDLSLSALSCCKSVFYFLEGVNGHMGVRNLTDKSAFLTYQFSVLFYFSL